MELKSLPVTLSSDVLEEEEFMPTGRFSFFFIEDVEHNFHDIPSENEVIGQFRLVLALVSQHFQDKLFPGKFIKFSVTMSQGGITCGAIDELRKSSKAIDKRVIIDFRNKNVVIARFRDINEVFI